LLLNGFTCTPAQAKALADAGITANHFIFLKVLDNILVECVVGHGADPVSGKIYHMKFNSLKDEEILACLVHRLDDTKEKVKVRLEKFHSNVAAVKRSYLDIAIMVDSTKNSEDVLSQSLLML
jgi:adenylate kinase family enzyme